MSEHGTSEATVRELSAEKEWQEAYPILRELRSHLEPAEMERRHRQMRDEGYRLFGRYAAGDLVSVAGVTLGTNFYLGPHCFVHDLITTERQRSKGHGAALLSYVHDWSREQGCETVELESGLWREAAHEFYEDLGYERYCYSFKYELD
ncbi:GNAT family N-acetyltransferase [Natrononativus amylolyticus]|uniref:GNAT family N-acetyltransferase n=1 Tax=Natrononativus amylolyticus TaxID=2963434 RepID=UPI0020CE0109|nr:GNAT family N-acetyltransferase [Natrononativus amylolyticus]